MEEIRLLKNSELTIQAINELKKENILSDLGINKAKAQQLTLTGAQWKMAEQILSQFAAKKIGNLEVILELEKQLVVFQKEENKQQNPLENGEESGLQKIK